MRSRIFYIVRHGESEANARYYPAGQSDSRLTKKGCKQAQETKDLVSWMRPRPTMIVASPLCRAAHTAHILNESLALPVFYDRWLKEQHYGRWQGRAKEGLYERYGAAWRDSAPGGESFSRFSRRVTGRVSHWLDRCGAGAVPMFVCHGGVIEAMARQVAGLDLRSAGNCTIVRFIESRRGGTSRWDVCEMSEALLPL